MKQHIPFTLGLFLFSSASWAIPMDEQGFSSYIHQQFKQHAPNLNIEENGRLMLKADGHNISLKRIFSSCLSNNTSCEQDIKVFVSQTTQDHKEKIAPPKPEEIFLVLRSKEFVERTKFIFKNKGDRPISKTFINNWVWVPVQNNARTTRTLSADVLEKLNISEEELFQLGEKNLRNYFSQQPLKPVSANSIAQVNNDFFASSRLLFPDLWQNLAQQQNNILIVSTPVSNSLLYTADDSPATLDKLKASAEQIINKSTTPLSTTPLKWSAQGWQTLP